MKESAKSRVASYVSSPTVTSVLVHLSPRAFALSWCLIMLLHAICALYYYYVIRLHLFLKVMRYTDYLGLQYFQFFDFVIAMCGLLGVGHIISILAPVVCSILKRELTFDMLTLKPEKRHFSSISFKFTWPRVVRMVIRAFYACFGRRGFFGIENPNFTEIFVVREIVENILQTIQAYQLSTLVSSIWINRVFTLVIVANCWSSPIVNLMSSWQRRRRISPEFESHPTDHVIESIRKTAFLGSDMLLNGFASIVVPVIIIYSYVRDWDPNVGDFPFLFWYNDTWFIKAVGENSQIFVRSWFDFICKVLPGFSVLTAIHTMRSIICDSKVVSTEVQEVCIRQTDSTTAITPVNNSKQIDTPKGKTSQNIRLKLFHRMADTFLFIWGLGVLLLHIYATSVAIFHKIPGCLLEIRPWFSTQYNCVVLELHCDRILRTHNNTVDMDTVLKPLSTWSIQSIIISSCPQLVMPTRITAYRKLLVLKTYNSTIQEWSDAAALQETKHPNLQFLFMVETNMSTLPPGLLSPDFPDTIQDIEICGTNLTSLPDNLHEFWGTIDEEFNHTNFVDFFFYEKIYGGLSEVPSTLLRSDGLQVRALSLCASGLTSIPEFLLGDEVPHMYDLEISSNPLVGLPARSPKSHVQELRLQYCENFKELPLWVYDPEQSQVTILLGGTPFCDTYTPTSSSSSNDGNSPVQIDCSVEGDLRKLIFPLDYEVQMRKISAGL